jgi:hypothetical protein
MMGITNVRGARPFRKALSPMLTIGGVDARQGTGVHCPRVGEALAVAGLVSHDEGVDRGKGRHVTWNRVDRRWSRCLATWT